MSRKNTSPLLSVRSRNGDLHPGPLLLGEDFGFTLWIAACFSGHANPSRWSPLSGFMERWRLTPISYEATQAKGLASVPTIILCEARGLWLFWVVRGAVTWKAVEVTVRRKRS